MVLCISPSDILSSWEALQMNEEADLGPQGLSSLWRDIPDHPGLISFRMDWLDLLGVQRTLKSLRNIKKEVCLHSDSGWL